MKSLNKLIKKWTKLRIIYKWKIYSIYNNKTLNYYKLIKEYIKLDSYGINLKLMKNYSAFTIELGIMILETESMDNYEKQYWFDIMVSMTYLQVNELYDILINEKSKSDKLDISYKKEIKRLDRKHEKEYENSLINEIENKYLKEIGEEYIDYEKINIEEKNEIKKYLEKNKKKLKLEKYNKLCNLIIETDSMDNQEKIEWFKNLEDMSIKKVNELEDILINEKEKLRNLSKKAQLNDVWNTDENIIYNVKINPNIKINNEEQTIKYFWKTFIKNINKYGTMYNYISIILENKDFNDIEKQFYISIINDLDKFSYEDRIYYIGINTEDDKKDVINNIIYDTQKYYWRATQDNIKYFVFFEEGKIKNEITDLEQLIIDSKILNNFEKQDYLVLINSMNKKEISDFEKRLSKSKKVF